MSEETDTKPEPSLEELPPLQRAFAIMNQAATEPEATESAPEEDEADDAPPL